MICSNGLDHLQHVCVFCVVAAAAADLKTPASPERFSRAVVLVKHYEEAMSLSGHFQLASVNGTLL